MATTGATAGFFGITAPSAYAETLADSLGLNKLASNWTAALGTTAAAGEAPGKAAGGAAGEGDGADDAAQMEVQKQLKQLTCVRGAHRLSRATPRAACAQPAPRCDALGRARRARWRVVLDRGRCARFASARHAHSALSNAPRFHRLLHPLQRALRLPPRAAQLQA